MTALRPSHRAALLLPALLLLLAGCPVFTPGQLSVSPGAVFFEASDNTRTIQISNPGSGLLEWTIEEVTQAGQNLPWIAGDVSWLSVDTPTGSVGDEVDSIRLRVDRTGLAVDLYTGAGVRVTASNGDVVVVPVSLDVAPTMEVSPREIALGDGDLEAQFVISNTGAESLTWTIGFVADPLQPNVITSLPADFAVSPAVTQLLAPQTSVVIGLDWQVDRDEFYLAVTSGAGSALVHFYHGAVLSDLVATPSPLTLFIEGTSADTDEPTPSTLHIENTGNTDRTWTLEAQNRLNPTVDVPLGLSAPAGTTLVGQESTVDVVVTDVTEVEVGSGYYRLVLTSDDAVLEIPIIVEILSLPEIALCEPPEGPRPEVTVLPVLDFGQEDIRLQFYVANVGPRTSDLFFRITHDDQVEVDPLIEAVSTGQLDPLTGSEALGEENVFFHPPESNNLINGVPVTVTVNRRSMTEDVEFRTITVSATDPTYTNTLDAVEPATIQVRVERKPLTIEGATNRSRPPYVMRFVFLLRDMVGDVIATQTQAERDRITFNITEDGRPLDLDETNTFVTGPESLKVNLVLMLDFTGSMYNAGTDDPTAPLAQGEAIEQVKAVAARFIDDLPPTYRVALMYYHKRQQPQRVLHAFSTDRDSLKEALLNFSLAPEEHLQSYIRDAVVDAVDVLEAEDSGDALPFDEADVRALLFITDGVDNGSVADLNTAISTAQDARVRLYPLAYAPMEPIDSADLLVMAEDTGGTFYGEDDVDGLLRLLSSADGIALERQETAIPNALVFRATNQGEIGLDYFVEGADEVDWLTVSQQVGFLSPGESDLITITLTPQNAPADAVEHILTVASARGEATVTVRMDVAPGGASVEDASLSLRDQLGTVWNDLQNQLALTYVTPSQVGGSYVISASYEVSEGEYITGQFEKDGVFYPGTDIAGQLSMNTTGIPTEGPRDSAEVYVRADYMPTGVNRFRLRFYIEPPDTISEVLQRRLREDAQISVEIVEDGLLMSPESSQATWSLVQEPDDVYWLITEQHNPLPYGSFGNLLKVTVSGLGDYVAAFDSVPGRPKIFLSMRVDNSIYLAPATPTRPSETKYFLYPSGATYPGRRLEITTLSDLAPAALSAEDLAFPLIDPEADFAWDRDEDGFADFDDPDPDDDAVPSSVVAPDTIEVAADVNQVQFRIVNNRLDTFNWAILDPLPSWVVTPIVYGPDPNNPQAPDEELSPGEEQIVNFSVDRTGIPAGSLLEDSFDVWTDKYGTVTVDISLLAK